MNLNIVYLLIGIIIIINLIFVIFIMKNKNKIKKDSSSSSPVFKMASEEKVDEYSKTKALMSEAPIDKSMVAIDEFPSVSMEDKTEVLGGISNLTTKEKDLLKQQNLVEETTILGTVPPNRGKKRFRAIEYQKAEGIEIYNWDEDEAIVIGRDPENSDLTILHDSFIGRTHALIYKKLDKYYLVDLNSKNGTFIDNIALKGQKEIDLQKPFQLGQTQFVIK